MKTYVTVTADKGRGVFAGELITSGETIESCPVIIFPEQEWNYIENTEINQYCYYWGEELKDGALVLGLGSIYNHSFHPNAKYIRHLDTQTMEYTALRDIQEGEEITINYNGVPDDESPLWFDVL